MNRKFNVLHYIETSGPGGAETVLLNVARNIDRDHFYPRVILHKSRWLHEQLQKNGIDTEIIPSKRSWDMPFLFNFIKYCRRHKIDLIHSHLFGANLYACLAGAIMRIPVLTTFHNELKLEGSADKFIRLKSIIIRTFSKKMAFVADYIKDEYVNKIHFPPRKMVTVYNGVEIDSRSDEVEIENLRKELEISDGDSVIVHIANFRVPKGHNILIEAAARVCKELPSTKFLLAGDEGDGELKKEVVEFSKNLGIADNIKVLGFRKDIGRLLDLADVFVLPSISEAMPLSVIEAMAAGKPVVATDVGGLSEIVESDRTGFLVQPGNSRDVAEKIISLLKNENLRIEMGRAGKNIIEEKFSMAGMIRNYQVLYTELLS